MTTQNFTLPAYWASALINDDFSGLDNSEEQEIKDFIAKNKKPFHRFYCVGTDGEQWFKWRNDANSLGGDVLRFTFDVTKITTSHPVS